MTVHVLEMVGDCVACESGCVTSSRATFRVQPFSYIFAFRARLSAFPFKPHFRQKEDPLRTSDSLAVDSSLSSLHEEEASHPSDPTTANSQAVEVTAF